MQNQVSSREARWTILDVLKWTTAYFGANSVEGPRASAEILLAHALGLRRIDLYIRHDQPMNADEREGFKALIRRRIQREPVAYITGEKEFWSLPFAVTPEVLIPRPETECLVEAVLSHLPVEPADSERLRVLDLGTGSGAIVTALAHERPGHLYFASDASWDALAVAMKNAGVNGVREEIRFFLGEWLEPIRTGRPGFDLILSNPPYISTRELDTLSPEVARFEPRGALDGGEDGLDAIRRILARAPGALVEGGRVFLEIGHDQGERVRGMAADSGFFQDIRVTRDYSGLDRVVSLKRR